MAAISFDRHNHVAIITLNRPAAMNALDFAANDELIAAWEEFRDDARLRVAVLTGAGNHAFCAGADLKTYTLDYFQQSATAFRRTVTDGPGFGGITRNLDVYKPIIAAINGYCISGGLELALACDIRLASKNAEIAFQDVRWGFHPPDGGSVRLPLVVGLGNALEMILTGDRYTADEAQRMGLVNSVVEPDELMPSAMQLAERIASRAPLAVQGAKEALLRGLGRRLEEALWLESTLAHAVEQTDDLAEGVRAFAEKRTAQFEGK